MLSNEQLLEEADVGPRMQNARPRASAELADRIAKPPAINETKMTTRMGPSAHIVVSILP